MILWFWLVLLCVAGLSAELPGEGRAAGQLVPLPAIHPLQQTGTEIFLRYLPKTFSDIYGNISLIFTKIQYTVYQIFMKIFTKIYGNISQIFTDIFLLHLRKYFSDVYKKLSQIYMELFLWYLQIYFSDIYENIHTHLWKYFSDINGNFLRYLRKYYSDIYENISQIYL